MAISFNISDYGLTNVEAQSNRASLESDIKKSDGFKQAFDQAVETGDDQQLMTACKDFESYFLQMLYKEMRKTTGREKDSLIPKSQAEEYFQEMLDEQYSISSTNVGGIGLANFLYRQLSGQYQIPVTSSPFANDAQSPAK